jgi:uncharacterized protein
MGTTLAAASIAALAILVTGLSIQVSRLRLRHKVSYGDGGHRDLLVAMRAHGNALEQSSLFAVLALAAASLPAMPPEVMAPCCAAFVLARLVHPWGTFGRRLGMRQAAHVCSTVVHLVLALAIGWTLATAR